MAIDKRPYLIIPKLIEQPTWGGNYILCTKGWDSQPSLQGRKIGQSYELFGRSKLALYTNDSTHPAFVPEFGFADKPDTTVQNNSLREGKDYLFLDSLIKQPLLIKFTQAAGNSFQLHIKPSVHNVHWRPKPESWYFFEDGYLTLGIKKNADMGAYRKTCEEIDLYMKGLSQRVRSGDVSVGSAREEARSFIQKKDPWQFVNTYEVEQDTLIDLSMGGTHHSWEEDKEKYPLGNVLYEVQLDVMDPVSTIRSFDQGKIKDDGSIRPLNISDYFRYIDTDPTHNNLSAFKKKPQSNCLLKTPFYSLDRIDVKGMQMDSAEKSFLHFFMKKGAAKIRCSGGEVYITEGHSCFIPPHAGQVEIKARQAVILKTYIAS